MGRTEKEQEKLTKLNKLLMMTIGDLSQELHGLIQAENTDFTKGYLRNH